MMFLALGTAADFYVVVEKVLLSAVWALVAAGLALVLRYRVCFGYAAYCRTQPERSAAAHSR
jgi:hypothetical protein